MFIPKKFVAALTIPILSMTLGCASLQKEKEGKFESSDQVNESAKTYSASLFFQGTSADEIRGSLEDIINNKRNLLIIKSSGGNVESAMAFYDTVKYALKKKITVIGVGQISSSAVIMFCVGEKRLIGKNSYMLLHNINTTFKSKNPTEKDKKEGRDQVTILESLYAKIISETTNGKVSQEQVKEMMNKSTTLTAPEVVKMGIATDLLDDKSF